MFLVGPEGSRVPLCLDCNLKLTQLQAAQNAESERMINYLVSQMESSVGLPVSLPRFPERRIIQGGNVALNNIKVSNSTIGVLNTGNVQTIDSALTVLRESGDAALSKGLTDFSQAVLAHPTLAAADKDKLCEILSVVATEATAPKEKRRPFAIRPLLQELATLAGGAAGLAELYDHLRPLLEAAFR